MDSPTTTTNSGSIKDEKHSSKRSPTTLPIKNKTIEKRSKGKHIKMETLIPTPGADPRGWANDEEILQCFRATVAEGRVLSLASPTVGNAVQEIQAIMRRTLESANRPSVAEQASSSSIPAFIPPTALPGCKLVAHSGRWNASGMEGSANTPWVHLEIAELPFPFRVHCHNGTLRVDSLEVFPARALRPPAEYERCRSSLKSTLRGASSHPQDTIVDARVQQWCQERFKDSTELGTPKQKMISFFLQYWDIWTADNFYV